MTIREDAVLDGLRAESNVDARELPAARAQRQAKNGDTLRASLSLVGASFSVSTRSKGVVCGDVSRGPDASGRFTLRAWGAGVLELALDDVMSVTATDCSREVYKRISERQRARFGTGGRDV